MEASEQQEVPRQQTTVKTITVVYIVNTQASFGW